MSANSLFSEIQIQLHTFLPTLASFFIYRMPWLISLRFVGRIGAEELAAAAFANSLCNIMGMALTVGLNSAMTTLASQARGDILRQAGRRLKAKASDVIEGDVEMKSLMAKEETGEVEYLENQEHQSSNPFVQISDQRPGSSEPIVPLVYLYRGIFVQLLFVVPVSCWWVRGIKPLLLLIGQTESLSVMTEDYLRILAPGLISYAVNWTVVTWLQAIGLAKVNPVVAAIGLFFHVPVTYMFVYTLNFGYLGCAMATSCFQFIQPLILLLYLFYTRRGKKLILDSMGASALGISELAFLDHDEVRAAVGSFTGVVKFLKLAVPGLIAISEWWASELVIVLAGRLKPSPELALGAMTMFQSLNSLCYIFPISFSVAGAMRVGNLLGAGHGAAAAFSAKVMMLLSGTTSGFLGIILYILPHSLFPAFFAPSEDALIDQTSHVIPFLSLYVFGDALACGFNGIVKGCGRQAVAVPVVIVSYWVVGVPVSYYLAFVQNDGLLECGGSWSILCGDQALAFGTTLGTWVHMALLGVVVVARTDWNEETQKAGDRVGSH